MTYVKNSSTWNSAETAFIKVDGTWKNLVGIKTKVDTSIPVYVTSSNTGPIAFPLTDAGIGYVCNTEPWV